MQSNARSPGFITRSRFRLRRYYDLFLYVAISVTGLAMPLPQLAGWIVRWVRTITAPSPTAAIATVLLATAFTGAIFNAVGLVAFRHPRHIARYPPLWTAAVGSGILLVFADRITGAGKLIELFEKNDLILLAVALFTGWMIRQIYFAFAINRPTIASTRKTLGHAQEPWWTRSPAAASDSDDRFDRLLTIARVADNIKAGKSLALTGGYGEGKTFVLDRAFSRLDTRKIWPVRIDGWGLSDDMAGEFVLRRVANEISRRIDPLRLARVPRQYRDALTTSNRRLGGVLSSISTDPDPIGVLVRLDEMLAAAGTRVVIVLEDLDRNLGIETDGRSLRQTAALLDRLGQLHNVSFAIGIDANRIGSIDTLRLCDVCEPLSPIPVVDVLRELHLLFQYLYDKHTAAETVVTAKELDHWLGFYRNATHLNQPSMDSLHQVGRASRSAYAVARLLANPRALKTTFVRVESAWTQLRGEVDPIDLVVIETLRVTRPSSWSFITAEIEAIRSLDTSAQSDLLPRTNSGQRDREQIQERHRHMMGAHQSMANEVDVLIHRLFGSWIGENDTNGSVVPDQGKTTQSATQSNPSDYLRRLIREDVNESPTDQEFLVALSSWLQDASHPDLIAMLSDSQHAADLLEHFKTRLPSEKILPLAEMLFVKQTIRTPNPLATYDAVPGYSALYRIAANGNAGDPSPMLYSISSRLVATSLMLTTSAMYFWTYDRLVINADASREAADWHVYDACRSQLTTGESWLKVLPPLTNSLTRTELPEIEYCLYHLVRGRGHTIPAAAWSWAAPRIVDAGSQDPDRIAFMLRPLLAKQPEGTASSLDDSTPYEINLDFLDAWCPDRAIRSNILVLAARPVTFAYTTGLHRKIQELATQQLNHDENA